MKTLKIEYLEFLNETTINEATEYLMHNIDFEYINILNWPTEFPYQPNCKFKIVRSDSALYIYFEIVEKNIKALYENDHEPVWKDSCVEFFCKLPLNENYMNFEFNCIGACIASSRKGREKDVVQFSKNEMKTIERISSLGNKKFNQKEGLFNWNLTVKIPFNLLGFEQNNLPEHLFGNFYKCADESITPHFLSWNEIKTEHPDFHQPSFFGKLMF